MKNNNVDIEKLRLRLADTCARSEQCEFDIMTKLARAGASREEADEIINFLKDNKFLDNSRYARAFVNDKVRFAGWGRMKIRAGLLAKRVSSGDIAQALEQIDEAEYEEALMRVAETKSKGLNLSDYRQRQKFYRSMMSRGFESADISRAISRL